MAENLFFLYQKSQFLTKNHVFGSKDREFNFTQFWWMGLFFIHCDVWKPENTAFSVQNNKIIELKREKIGFPFLAVLFRSEDYADNNNSSLLPMVIHHSSYSLAPSQYNLLHPYSASVQCLAIESTDRLFPHSNWRVFVVWQRRLRRRQLLQLVVAVVLYWRSTSHHDFRSNSFVCPGEELRRRRCWLQCFGAEIIIIVKYLPNSSRILTVSIELISFSM